MTPTSESCAVMSLPKPNDMVNVRLYVVVDSEDEAIVKQVQDDLKARCPQLGFSPAREQESLNHSVEFFGTARISKEAYDELYRTLNNDWDGEEDDCSAYGYNTKMFNPHVYYLQMEY